MKTLFKRFCKKIFNLIGLDLVRIGKNSDYCLLGLKELSIRTIIDVGANTGQFSRSVMNVFPDVHIYCFEPLPEPFKKLSQWAMQQRADRVSLFNIALGDKVEEAAMFVHAEHSPSSSLLKTTKTAESLYPCTQKQAVSNVQVSTLDNWLNAQSQKLEQGILIKLDVQGYEDRVIRGGSQLFDLARACIVEIAFDKLYDGQATFAEVFRLLSEKGFHYAGNLSQCYARDGHVVYIDAVFVK